MAFSIRVCSAAVKWRTGAAGRLPYLRMLSFGMLGSRLLSAHPLGLVIFAFGYFVSQEPGCSLDGTSWRTS